MIYEEYTSTALYSQSCGAAGHPNMGKKKKKVSSIVVCVSNLHHPNNKLQMHCIHSAAVLPGTQIWGVKSKQKNDEYRGVCIKI